MLDVDLQHRLGSFQLKVRFTADPGVTALFGRSGAGKSSTVNAIAGLLRPQQGRIVVDGRILFDSDRGIDQPAWRRQVGYVFQDGRLFPHLTVHQNLVYADRMVRRQTAAAEFGRIVEMLGLGVLLERRPGDLSGGEAQRVAIGRALLRRPKILLMDEPLASLDRARRAEILPYIEQLRDATGLPVVYVSHDLDEVTRLATTMVVLSEGAVAAAGPVADVVGRMALSPLADSFEAGAVINARVVEHDAADDLTRLRCRAGDLYVPRVDAPVGHELRAHILSRDAILARAQPAGLSALNIFRGVVAGIRETGTAAAYVQVDCSGEILTAKITRRSVRHMQLAPGREVYVVIKSMALSHVGQAGLPQIYRQGEL
jgi:molybdate transport system ATP-binding protein